MTKRSATLLTLAAVVLVMVIPTLLAVGVARKEALEGEKNRVLSYATEALHRSDSTAAQVDAGIRALVAESRSSGPCSDAALSLMRRIDTASSYVQSVGHVSGTRLLCSSIGQDGPLELGSADLLHPGGVKLRTAVQFPFAPGTSFIVIERDGFAAIIHKDLPIDVAVDERQLSIAVLSRGTGRVLTGRGTIRPEWADRLDAEQSVAFLEDGQLVAVSASRQFQTVVVAAIPTARLEARTRSAVLLLVPVGLVAGLLLAAAVLYLARLQFAMPAIIRAALRRHEFFMLYQPIVDLQSGRVVGAEALIRWRRPGGEMIRPDLFIPAAEDSGQIQQITERVCELVANDAAGLFERYPDFHLSINLSPADLHAERTIALMRRLARATGARAGNLIVEATERGFIQQELAGHVAHGLRGEGFSIAVDDFGTGYSSLAYLETFDLDYLKIDKIFIDTLGTAAATSQVVPHIIEMAKSLNLAMVAEGVETEAQAAYLRERGVQFAQGWLFGQPVPIWTLLERVRGIASVVPPPG